MTEKEYNSANGVRRSDLWRIDESPEKFKWYLEHPIEPTPALIFGQAAHKAILEPDTWSDEFAVAPDIDRRTKAGKEQFAEFMAENADKTVITQEEYTQIQEMSSALFANDIAKELLNGVHEVPLFWTDEETGELCKVKLDCMTSFNGTTYVVDYKTANSAHTDKFNSDIYKYGYFMQAAMYTEAVRAIHGSRPEFIFVVQEKKPPYSVNVIQVTEDVMMAGYDKFRELLGIYHECKVMDNWYGYMGPFNTINDAYLPGWMNMGEEE